jgi:hypothetical protein
MTRESMAGLIVHTDPLTLRYRARIVELAATRRLPAMYGFGEFAQAGGLMVYGPGVREMFRHLCRSNSQGCEARRPPRGAAYEVRVGDKHENRQGTRPHDPAVAAPACGRGHSVMDRREFIIVVASGLLAARIAVTQQAGKVPRIGCSLWLLGKGRLVSQRCWTRMFQESPSTFRSGKLTATSARSSRS